MKLGPDMYLLNTFHIPKNEGVNEWVEGRCIQKTTKKYYEINKIGEQQLKNHAKEAQTDCFWDFEDLLKGKYKLYIDETWRVAL